MPELHGFWPAVLTACFTWAIALTIMIQVLRWAERRADRHLDIHWHDVQSILLACSICWEPIDHNADLDCTCGHWHHRHCAIDCLLWRRQNLRARR